MSRGPTAAADTESAVYRRPRAFVGVKGADAASHLNKMLSNEIEGLDIGAACEALLLTPKARVIALLVVYRRGVEDFLLITDPGLDEVVSAALVRARFAAKVEIEPEAHPSYVVLGAHEPEADGALVVESREFGHGYELIGLEPSSAAIELSETDAEALRIEAGMPRFGAEIDERTLPAEAGLVERTISFDKGCYPGQEPIARLHYRGHTNRSLRVLRIESSDAPPLDTEIHAGDRVVGRVTSAVLRGDHVVALAYVRNEVAADADLDVAGATASMIEPVRP